jgi:secondary thiamine-phosphate synthase enzyme
MKSSIKTNQRVQFIDITDRVREAIKESQISRGIVNIFVPHTTAAITINENSDPSVIEDMTKWLAHLVPENAGFKHSEGNSDAHIKASIVGSSVTVPFDENGPQLGIWQGVYFCEFDGPRIRNVIIRVSQT